MKFGTGIGIVISCIGIAMGATMEGTNVMVVINIPAILIVLVLGAILFGITTATESAAVGAAGAFLLTQGERATALVRPAQSDGEVTRRDGSAAPRSVSPRAT